jgi:FkbM family methyltransferase
MTSPLPTTAWGSHRPKGWRARALALCHAAPWRRLALWLRKPLKGRVGDWVDTETWGLRLRLAARGNLSEQRLIFLPNHLDRTEREVLAAELKDGGVFFDIGANAGVYSLWVASACGPKTRIEAFEPDPELCARLRFNLATNRLDHVHLNPMALGRTEGSIRLVSGDGNKGQNHVAQGTEGIAVEMTTLPAFLARHGLDRIDALKIDVEGHEVDVLEPLFAGAPRSAWPRLLIAEVTHDPSHRLTALLRDKGYTLSGQGRLNGIYRLPA